RGEAAGWLPEGRDGGRGWLRGEDGRAAAPVSLEWQPFGIGPVLIPAHIGMINRKDSVWNYLTNIFLALPP
ncbi:MAG: hypothetical protein K2J15_06575, partial [Muribaculaceae bacterium]|nr:hypothetical protein [Muribaculaceae bacterium]